MYLISGYFFLSVDEFEYCSVLKCGTCYELVICINTIDRSAMN